MLFRLPVSGQTVLLREPNGHDEILLGGSHPDGFRVKVDVVRRLAPTAENQADWNQLPAADVDPALLSIRRHILGDRVVAEVLCTTCGAKGDLSFSVREYLRALAPKNVRGVQLDSDGWYSIKNARLRIPTVADLLAIEREFDEADKKEKMLAERCIEVATKPDNRRARRILERMAPLLSGEMEGRCPECGATVKVWFDPGKFALIELRQRSESILEQVHLLASRYGWAEQAILDLPTSRRMQYVELIINESRRSVEQCASV